MQGFVCAGGRPFQRTLSSLGGQIQVVCGVFEVGIHLEGGGDVGGREESIVHVVNDKRGNWLALGTVTVTVEAVQKTHLDVF